MYSYVTIETVKAPFRSAAGGWKNFSDTVCNTLPEKAAKFLEKHLGAALIIVTGPTGVGKSSFIKSVTGSDIYVSSSLTSGTRNTALVPAVIEGKRYLFLDMPGFDADDLDDWHIFIMLMTAMATVQRYVTFRGLVYVDTFDKARATTSARKILTWVQHFCGNEYMANVTVVNTMWDVLNDDGIDRKFELYATWSEGELLQPLLSNGAETFHHGIIRDGDHWQKLSLENKAEERALYAKNMIHERYHEPSNVRLKVYTEIEAGHDIETTSAGSWLKTRSVTQESTNPHPASQDPDILEIPYVAPKDTNFTPPPQNSSSDAPRASKPQPRPSTSWAGILEDAMPWVRLLVKAARVFYQAEPASANRNQRFEDSFPAGSEDEDFWEDGSRSRGYRNSKSSSDASNTSGFNQRNKDETSWCMVM